MKVSFPGIHQRVNIPLVCETVKYLSANLGFSYPTAIDALHNASMPGRMTFTSDRTIIDGAHNPQAVETVVKNILHYFGKEKFMVIFGALKDKDVGTNLRHLAKIAKSFTFVNVRGARKSYSAEELLAKYEGVGMVGARTAELIHAINDTSSPKLVIGSFYLAGDALKKYFSTEEIINWRLK